MMQTCSLVKRSISFHIVKDFGWCRMVVLTLAIVFGVGHAALADSFVPATGTLNAPRKNHTATLLTGGKVLFTGGLADPTTFLDSAEIYDPGTEQCTPQQAMQSPRAYHTATPLNDGRVLIVGGIVGGTTMTNTAEIFDPANGTFTSTTGNMSVPRARHTATLLANGKVLITGGGRTSGTALLSAELYDPSTGTFTATGNMHALRYGHTATLLSDGKVLIAGGSTNADTTNSAETYDPATGIFTVAGNMTSLRRYHTATRLSNNTVLITGGQAGSSLTTLNTAEIYTPNGNPALPGSFSATNTPMLDQRQNHQANLLSDGTVRITGGQNFTDPALFSSEQFVAGGFGNEVDMNAARSNHTATMLADGVTVLIAGGSIGTSSLNSIEMYNSASLEVRPVAYSFGNTLVNTQQSHSFTVTNTLGLLQPLTIGFTGTDVSSFSATGCDSLPVTGCTVTVTFKPTTIGNKQATMTLQGQFNTVSVALSGTGTVLTTYLLTVTGSGNGTGTVASTPGGINNCQLSPSNTTCSATFAPGQITLAATPSGSPPSSSNASYFSGWAGPAGCSGSSCIFTLSGPTTATASFYLYPATIGKTTYYATLQDAYNGAASGNEIWLAGSYGVSQSVNLARNIPVVVKGGYDDGFGNVTGYSTIGILTIGQGSAVVDRLIVH